MLSFIIAAAILAAPDGDALTRVEVSDAPEPMVRYVSGSALCMESLHDGRWLVRFRSGDGRIPMADEWWTEDAFTIAVDGNPVDGGWEWEGSAETKALRGGRSATVSLWNRARGIRVQVHTALDGTSVLTRWLTITNAADEPISLTGVSPWGGRLSRGEHFDLGYFTRDQHASEGGFEWKALARWGTTVASIKKAFDPHLAGRNAVLPESGHGFLFQCAKGIRQR